MTDIRRLGQIIMDRVAAEVPELGGRVQERATLGLAFPYCTLTTVGHSARTASVHGRHGRAAAADRKMEAEQRSLDALEAQTKANKDFTASEDARNSSTAAALKLDREIADVRKRAAELGARFSDDQIRAFADANMSAEARRAAEGRGGSKGKSGGGKSESKKDEPSLFEDAERDLLNLEREIRLVGMSTAEVAKLRAQWAMLDEAKQRGLPVNDELNAKIQAQAEQVGQLTEQLERAEIGQQRFEEAVDGIADAFAGALVAGESLRDGLGQVFKQIAADILTSGIRRSLMNVFGGTGLFQMFMGGGDRLTGALRMAGAFDDGGYTGAGGKHQPAGVVHRGEVVWSQKDVARAGGVATVEAMRLGRKGYADGGSPGVPVMPSIARPAVVVAQSGSAGSPLIVTFEGDLGGNYHRTGLYRAAAGAGFGTATLIKWSYDTSAQVTMTAPIPAAGARFWLQSENASGVTSDPVVVGNYPA